MGGGGGEGGKEVIRFLAVGQWLLLFFVKGVTNNYYPVIVLHCFCFVTLSRVWSKRQNENSQA